MPDPMSLVTLQDFKHFANTTEGLEACTALVESKLPRGLRHFLKKAVVKKVAVAKKTVAKKVAAAKKTVAKKVAAAKKAAPAKKAAVKKAVAKKIGEFIAERCKAKGIEAVVFDRNGYPFHGRVKALADAAREKGLKF